LDNSQNLKVIASANGDTQVKNVTGNDLDSKSTSVLFEFNEKNDIGSVDHRNEYFACAYAISGTNEMETYSCVEGNIEKKWKKYHKFLFWRKEDLVNRVLPNC
jgi:hypothetical protein